MQQIKSVLVSPPGVEASLASLYPNKISLFEPVNFPMILARQDHEKMQGIFQGYGIEIHNMRLIIGEQFTNEVFKNKPLPKEINTLSKLRTELISRATIIHNEYLGDHKQSVFGQSLKDIDDLLQKDLELFKGNEKAVIAINALYTYCIDIKGNYVNFDVKSDKYPMGNQIFWRDTNHITGQSMGLHKMHFPIRQPEVAIARIGIEALGIPYSQIKLDKGSIEGGDVLPMEINGNRFALIGQAERTSVEGAHAWYQLHKKEFKDNDIIPLLIRGPNTETQTEMHLDTYFQQVSENGVIHCEDVTKERTVFRLFESNGEVKEQDLGKFNDYISHRFTDIYPMSRDEQLKYTPNVLVDGSRNVVFVTREITEKAKTFLEKTCGQKTEFLNMPHLTQLYGGAHCSTSEVR
jgi:arginine deiminase